MDFYSMYITILILLIILAAFFSASETGMMAVNRYRLRHLSKKAHPRAKRALKLLERPDRLLGVTLMGNTFAEIFASAIATIVALKFFGDAGVLIFSLILTFVILVFGEIAPKTLAALYSQRIALLVAMPLTILLKIFYPLVWIVNFLANGVLRIFGIHVRKAEHEPLSIDELRSVVHEATGKTSLHYQEMLLRVLDLQQLSVEEIMVPKNEIYGIDLDWDWNQIITQLTKSSHAYLPVYREHIDKIYGMLTLRQALVLMSKPDFSQDDLLPLVQEVYFIPEGALLHQQVLNFQKEKKHVGLVVDEYGDIQGMLTLRDLLEEIAGDFAMSAVEIERFISKQEDGNVLVDGGISIRVLNRLTGWHFPVNGPRTLSGLIIDYLENIPRNMVCVCIGEYRVEVISVSHNTIQQVRVLK
ncbi:MAG: magnesium/cobalt efflux protein [Gammaproteobacteria bacterium RIFCSPHIGHO2_12_FULL_36_30]|nr:MAG: magnesium/cobalt efflux protein [Gammaproteobacteria bacterium RIFCSPHIGHO2_12_FULL_36_30]